MKTRRIVEIEDSETYEIKSSIRSAAVICFVIYSSSCVSSNMQHCTTDMTTEFVLERQISHTCGWMYVKVLDY